MLKSFLLVVTFFNLFLLFGLNNSALAVPRCHLYSGGDFVPDGFVATNNLFTPIQEIPLNEDLHPGFAPISMHSGTINPEASEFCVNSTDEDCDGSAINGCGGISTANPNASAETIALLQYLSSLSSRRDQKVLSGQFVARESAYDKYVIGLYHQTGYWPALLGVDYYHETWEKDAKYDNMNRLAIDYWNNKGLVTINIHPFNPQTGGKARDGRINLEDVLTPGTASNIEWTRQLELIANGLDELQDAGVVVLWRPFHEMCGGWWWGMNNDEPPSLFFRLWKQMFDYFTYDRQLNNLLWVYTSGNCFDTYYPGDDYVDINGADYYGNEPWCVKGQQNIQINTSGKLFALTEFGPVRWDTETVISSPKFDFNILLDALKKDLTETIWFLEWHGVWSMTEHLNALDLLSDPIIINRGDITYFD